MGVKIRGGQDKRTRVGKSEGTFQGIEERLVIIAYT